MSKKVAKKSSIKASVSRDDIGKVHVVLYGKKGGVVADIRCVSPNDAVQLLAGILGLTSDK